MNSFLNKFLRRVHAKLGRRLDRLDNWNNDNPTTNGEWFLLDRIAPQLRIALDIGANMGDWTARLIAANPACVVHAFEASPRTFPSLSQRLGSVANVRLHQCGVGETAGQLPFFDYGENSGLSSFVSREGTTRLKVEKMLEVPVTTIDDFCALHGLAQLDFIKIDTEGFELAILRGMAKCLGQRRISLIQFEYGGTWLDAESSLAQAHILLKGHGYALYRLRRDCVERIDYNPRNHEVFKYANFLAAATPEILKQWKVPVWSAQV